MELEIKHLAPYLEYGLVLSRAEWLPPLTLVGLTTLDVFHNSGSSPIRYMTPHLRPLSQLTEDITHNGAKFVPIDFLDMYPEDLRIIINHGVIEANMNWHDAQKLFEWHFDVFDLLESGLAIEKPNH